MPFVTATPRGQNNGQVITEFIDSVGTTSVTYTYPKTQESLTVRNIGTKAITVTVGGTSQALQPGQRWENTTDFTAFSIISSSGVQAFEATADEKGSVFSSPEGRYLATIGGGTIVSKDARQVVGKQNQANLFETVTYAGAKGGNTYCQKVVFACDCYDVQFLFVNPVNASGAGSTNLVNVKVSLEVITNGNSVFYPLSSEGNRTFAVNPDGFVYTDVFPQAFKKNDIAYLRIFVSSPSNKFPVGSALVTGTGEGVLDGDYTNFPATITARFNDSVYSTNGTGTTATGTPTHQNSWTNPGGGAIFAADVSKGYSSVLTVGKPSPSAIAYPVVAIIGDSISRGEGSFYSGSWGYSYGFMQQAVDNANGVWIDIGQGGTQARDFDGVGGYDRYSFLNFCTHALVGYGVNDISNNTASDVRITEFAGSLQNIYNTCKTRGIGKVYACIPAVRTNTTDGYATLANQTAYNNGFVPRASGGNNTWQDLASWQKGNSVTPGSGGTVIPAPVNLDGYFDTESAVVVLKAGGIPVWPVGMTTDGVHPSGAGHSAMAAMIPASAFEV